VPFGTNNPDAAASGLPRPAEKVRVKLMVSREIVRARRLVRLAWLAAFLCTAVAPLAGSTSVQVPPSRHAASLALLQLHHTAWTASDGAPTWANEITQDNDGFLWLASSAGLSRFDGIAFDRTLGKSLNLPQLKTVHASPDGSLWLGFLLGGVGRIKEGHLTSYPSGPDIPSGTTFGFFDAPDGTVWLVATTGISHFKDGAWHAAGQTEGYDGRRLGSMSTTPDGSVWCYGNSDYLVLRPGTGRFVEVSWDEAFKTLSTSPSSTFFTRGPEYSAGTRDSQGVLWTATAGGLRRTRRFGDGQGGTKEETESFNTANGLTSNSISTTFEDREGNIWLATASGLDKFREAKATPVVFPSAMLKPAIALDKDNQVWVGSIWTGWRTTADASAHPTPAPALDASVTAIHIDPHGAVWTGGKAGLRRTFKGHTETVPLPAGLDADSLAGRYQAIATDAHEELWMSVSSEGVFERVNGQWVKDGGLVGLVDDLATRLYFDDNGRGWFTYSNGQVARVTNGAVRVFGTSDGLDVGSIWSVTAHGGEVWVGGDKGLARLDGERFRPLKAKPESILAGATGIVFRAGGDLWVHGNDGLVHVAASELAAARQDPAHAVATDLIGEHEGITGTEKLRPLPSMVAAPDGRLWLVSATSVSFLDPDHLMRNTTRPVPVIDRVMVDGQMYPGAGTLRLPEGPHNVQVFFTTGSLTVPERIRFDHRMDGVDKDWQASFGKRAAEYPSLGHGTYRFHLRVTNEDGMPSAGEVTVQVIIPPRFFATWWFILLSAVFASLLAWLVYIRHVRRLVTLLRVATLERERIARELHDSLLQSVQGLLLLLQATAHETPERSTRERLLRAAAAARATVVEGRAQVQSLRVPDADIDLFKRLADVATQLGAIHEAKFTCQSEGQDMPLRTEVVRELFPVLREMLTNAFQHARATHIILHLHFGLTQFEGTVTDDGVGMSQPVIDGGERAGHWGLLGMRERVAQLKGSFSVQSKEGAGTVVRVRVPGVRLYRQSLFVRLVHACRRKKP
jgi:ligand-binding sensor domain-containing protein/two-component sensor histidine kinase